jgi:hypothetical protein
MKKELDNRLTWYYFFFFQLKKLIRSFLSYFKILQEKEKVIDNTVFEIKKHFVKNKSKKKFVLFLCLESFEVIFFVIWSIVSISLRKKNYGVKVISTKKNTLINKLSKKFNFELLILENINVDHKLNDKLVKKIDKLETSNDFYNFKHHGFDLGCMIISNFCRIHKVGFINFHSFIQKKIIKNSLKNFIREYESLYNNPFLNDVDKVFTFEKNLFPYLHFFLFSLKKNIDLIHWSGSNLDEKTLIIKKYFKKNIYSHHSSISNNIWKKIKNVSSNKIVSRNKEIFKKRFLGKFAPFTLYLIECSKNLNLKINKINQKPNCIVFSHIIHDTLYFFGKEYYDSYSHWLVNTVKIACKNSNVNWYIKIHPSNIYRREFKKGFSKEEDIIRQEIRNIPAHVKFIYPDSKINPLVWMNFADVGITVRGTSGLEMAVLGKKVITCGKNRYENRGFTIDPKNKFEYEKMLLNLPKTKKLNKNFKMKANLFYNYIFEKKGFKCNFLEITNKNKIFNWNDLNFKIKKNFKNNKSLYSFEEFLLSKNKTEFLTKYV